MLYDLELVEPPSYVILCRILRKAGTAESLVGALTKAKTRDEMELRTKLLQIEADIDANGTEDGEIEEWAQIALFMWMKHASIDALIIDPIDTRGRPKLSTASISEVPTGFGYTYEEQLANVRPQSEFLAEWKQKFNGLEKIFDVTAMKKMLPLVAQALHESLPYGHDNEQRLIVVQSELFEYALSLVTHEMYLKYQDTAEHWPFASLEDLILFLQKEIYMHHDVIYAAQERQLAEVYVDFMREGRLCKHCDRLVNDSHECAKKKWTLCRRCFEYDHSEQNCSAFYSKEQLLSTVRRICQLVDQLKHNLDIGEMKWALLFTGKLQALMKPFWDDANLHQDICLPIIHKLPRKTRATFVCGRNSWNFTIDQLHDFIRGELCQLLSGKWPISPRSKFAEEGKEDQLQRMTRVCQSCFTFGHLKEECSRPIRPRLEYLK